MKVYFGKTNVLETSIYSESATLLNYTKLLAMLLLIKQQFIINNIVVYIFILVV